jgi:hypothetical protein
MKKLMLVVLALLGLAAATDASARGYYGRCYDRCQPKCCPKVCEPKCCPKPCVRVEEEPKPEPKCCVRYVRVEEPCVWTKHISWSCECPSTCQEEFGTKNYASEVVYADSLENTKY